MAVTRKTPARTRPRRGEVVVVLPAADPQSDPANGYYQQNGNPSGAGAGRRLLASDVAPTRSVPPLQWEPQPGESLAEFVWFAAYACLGTRRLGRDLGRRTINNLSSLLGVPERSLSLALRTWSWQARILAWVDAGQPPVLALGSATGEDTSDSIETQDNSTPRSGRRERGGPDWEARRAEVRETSFSMARLLVARAREMLSVPLGAEFDDQGKLVSVGPRWTMADVTKVVEVADRVARLAADMDTESARLQVDVSHTVTVRRMVEGILVQGYPVPVARERLVGLGVRPEDVDEACRQLGAGDPSDPAGPCPVGG